MTQQLRNASPSPIRQLADALAPLTPSQSACLERARTLSAAKPFIVIRGDQGVGKTTVLQHLHAQLGGRFLSCREALDAMSARHPHALDEAIRGLLDEALRLHDVVFFDDLDAIETVTRMSNAYPRPYLFNVVLKDLFRRVRIGHVEHACLAVPKTTNE